MGRSHQFQTPSHSSFLLGVRGSTSVGPLPCIYGERFRERVIMTLENKYCKKCDTVRSVTEFSKDKNRADGFYTYCRTCASADNKRIREARRVEHEYIEAQGLVIWQYKGYPDTKRCTKCKQTKSRWLFGRSLTHADGQNPKCLSCNYAVSSEWVAENPERAIAAKHNHYVNNKNAYDLWAQEYRARKAAAFVEVVKLDLILERDGLNCSYCNEALDFETKSAVHLDHVWPLNGGGLNCYPNMVAVCQPCNTSKSDTPPDVWIQKKGYAGTASIRVYESLAKKYLLTVTPAEYLRLCEIYSFAA